MENKINIAEILKNCPQGMELDCTMYDNVTLICVLDGNAYPIKIKTPGGQLSLDKYGQYFNNDFAKCVIFPKGKTTWEGFVPPRKYKNGDVVITALGSTAIIGGPAGNTGYYAHCVWVCGKLITDDIIDAIRFATESEKAELFKAIKENGFKWNEETKTLEELYHYPKTLYECCAILGLTELGIIGGYRHGLLTQFRNLLICRDAYWKIAGDWKPDWLNAEQDKYVIFTHNNAICSNRYVLGHNILAFPTEEMRDAFYENFKDPINECKSFFIKQKEK